MSAEPLLVYASSSTQHTWWFSWGWGLETTDRVPAFPGDTFPGLASLYTDEHTPHSLCFLECEHIVSPLEIQVVDGAGCRAPTEDMVGTSSGLAGLGLWVSTT